ncbi:hypothetical protein DSECCO2_183560 [anaerobic digester metagenome]
MYITPKAGLVVRNPATGEILPTTGAEIPPGPHKAYWLRRQQDGDVTITMTVPTQPAQTQPTKSKTSSTTEEGN